MIEPISRIADYIFADREKIKEGIGDIMGGKVLELESDKLIKIGEEKGIEKGIEKGKVEEQRLIAANLRKQGINIETIAQCTGLSIKEVSAL